jgi:primase-polymerase (primpol)-like protein
MHDINKLRTALSGPLAPLAQYKQFMLWRLETDPETGKPRKMPYSIRTGQRGSSTEPSDWCTAEEALTYANAWQMGVAFVFTRNDPFTFIDIDHCREGNGWSADALAICNRFAGAAIEVSQSGEGLHIFTSGDVPAEFSGRSGGIGGTECYHTWRFVALTGNCNAGSAAFNAGPALAQFIAERFPSKTRIDGELSWHSGPIAEAGNVPTDDNDLLRAFLSAPPSQPRLDAYQAFAHLTGRDAVRVERIAVSNADLFNANVAVLAQAWPSDHDTFDKSQAAFALACRLAVWTGKDCDRMERLMYRAAFQRTKADVDRVRGQTYMRFDIMRACVTVTNVRRWNAADANEEIRQAGENGYQGFYDRIAAAPDVTSIRAICDEAAYDLSIDRTYRELLAQHIQRSIQNVEGAKLPIADCRRMIEVRASHPAPDRQALQRQQNIAMNLPEDMPTLTPVMQTAQMLDEFVFIGDGSQVGSKYDRSVCFSLSDFKNLMAASRTVTPDGTRVHTEDWLTHAGRTSVATRTFRAGANVLTYDPNGRTALNMWRALPPRNYTVDVTPFYEHIKYLFADDAEKFLDWLAHIEQHPGVLPHHGWLHIADRTGTGRNWLSSVISRLWRGYVAPSVDMDALINGSFNGALAGRMIAIVDEIRTGAREDAYMMEGKIRNMLTEETRYIKPKYGKEYVEHNSCRWLLFSNHKNAIPMSDNDRRWYVVHLSGEPRPEHVYAHLYALLDHPGFIDSIGAWLRMRDISQFNPGARPPLNAAKLRAIDASKSSHQKLAQQIVAHWPCDIITVSDLVNIMHEGDMNAKRLNPAQRHALEDVGMHALDCTVYDDMGNKPRCWLVRNVHAWLAPGVLCKDNTAKAFATFRPYSKLGGFSTLMGVL